MITKGVGANLQRIGLMEVMWKAISSIINFRLLSSIQFYDALCGFHTGRGTGTATLKARLLQNIIAMTETVLHSIFLSLFKAYDDLYREHCLDILSGYGVRTRTIRILQMYWVQLHIEAKAGGHYGPSFQIHRGVTQGDPLSPTIFNVVVDAVIQHWVTVVGTPQ